MNTILIANRGEIAVRIMRACRELGIRSVAVYSDADRDALHVRLADDAHHIGPAPAVESYLNVERIIQAARRSGADAIHPGYGFLSERAHFARACAEAGLTFIGPSADAIERMGSKIEAKRLAIAHDVPVVPGYDGAQQSLAVLQREAERIGYPLLIKASAGGGGKGMRAVHDPADFEAALEGAKREALAAFGDDAVLLEKLIVRPRHVEIQILADQHGTTLYLGERECSIQRRHQKIIEEAPSVALTPELRARMGQAAVRVAQSVGYRNAGTVEFMLDQDQQFYFLEMNTRLQVEHPVTEFVTGRDLVHLQIAIARGEALPFAQDDITLYGHAIEARIYAEDPLQMLPSVGQVLLFAPPDGPDVRNDVGLASGDVVTVNYDPMLAKLIVAGPDRATTIERMQQALDAYAVLGIDTNIPLVQAVLRHPAFVAGDTTTDFLETNSIVASLQQDRPPPTEAMCAAVLLHLHAAPASDDPWTRSWRLAGSARRVALQIDTQSYTFSVLQRGPQAWQIRVRGALNHPQALIEVAHVVIEPQALSFEIDGQTKRVRYVHDAAILLAWGGASYRVSPEPALTLDALERTHGGATGQLNLAAPMPGTIIKVLVQPGDQVEPNQPLVVMEAMKMEHTIVAPYAAIIAAVPFAEGQLVGGGAVLIELDTAS